MRCSRARALIFFLAMCVGPVVVHAQETRRVVVGPQYAASGFNAAWLGDGYRALWTTEVSLPVLDLRQTAGGLTPVRVVGQAQSLGLAFRGADGRAYTFRSLHKHPDRMLPEAWRDAWPGKLAQQLTVGTHPGAALIQASLARTIGLPATNPRIVVVPDDPALGEFRQQFANEIGTIDEYPLAGPEGSPGFMGATEILTSPQFWERWLASADNRPDSRAYLRARVLDLWVDNYDRHSGQWRWMRIPGKPLWQPLPEDPDFVLVRHDGLASRVVRGRLPDFLEFSARYPGRLEGPLNNCYEVDRWVMADLDRAAWDEVARDVVSRLTDETIDAALRALPPEWHAKGGAQSAADLKARRAGLVDYVLRVYALEAKAVDVRATNQDDTVTIARNGDDSVEVTITAPAGATPYFSRRFSPRETGEVRIYLHGGDDRVTRTGAPGGPIRVRIIGGGGRDVIDESASGGSDVWRDGGEVEVTRGRGTKVREGVWVNPAVAKETPWLEPRNHGHWSTFSTILGYSADTGALVGLGVTRTAWGFRTKQAAASQQTLRGAFATSDVSGVAEYLGTFRRPGSSLAWRVHALGSGIEGMNFYGLGNETPAETDRSKYRARQDLFMFAPSLRLELGKRFEAFAAPEVRYSRTKSEEGSIVDALQPIGADDLGQVVLRAGFSFDSRQRADAHGEGVVSSSPQIAQSEGRVTGISMQASGFAVPEAWDVKSGYGGVEGRLAAYVGNSRAHVAVRVGGRKVMGDYAWFDAAYVGGSNNRGYASHRFQGDSSAFGTVSLRSWLGAVPFLVPVKVGVVAFADTGRVWLEGEQSNTWHNSVGGGLLFQPVATQSVVFAAIAHGKEGNRYYAGIGYPF